MSVATVERRQILTYDRVIKTRSWASVLIVNPKGDAEVNGLLAFCRQLRITVVWDPERVTPRAPPTEGMRREAVLARLRVTERANPRLYIMVGRPIELASRLAQEQHEGDVPLFSGAILAQLDDAMPLAPQLQAWAVLVAPDGLLIGKQHGDLKVRSELTRASPKWRPWPNGLWLVEVAGLSLGPVPPSQPPHQCVDRADRGAVASFQPPAEERPNGPLRQEAQAQGQGQAQGRHALLRQLGITLPIKRTRPVWETLEQNLRVHLRWAA